MKLLFDQNLSPQLVGLLADLFPDSRHVFDLGLDTAPDEELWAYARDHGFLIVSKDSDFTDFSTLHGFPPKVIWLRLGNCTTGQVETALRTHYDQIAHMNEDPAAGFISLI